jgi:sigma-E factor negative regulatory protein RseC
MIVEIPRSPACARCGICIQGKDQSQMILELKNPGGIRIGDQLVLELEAKRVIQAAAFAYGLPILGILLGAIVGSSFSSSYGEVSTLIGAGIGLATGLLAAICLDRTWGRKGRFEPRIVQIIRGDEDSFADS